MKKKNIMRIHTINARMQREKMIPDRLFWLLQVHRKPKQAKRVNDSLQNNHKLVQE